MNEQGLPIKSWAADERPREKLLKQGASALSLNELLAILLRSGVGGESALVLARRIMADCGNDLNILAKCGVRELINNYKGMGIAKAASIHAAIELGRRRKPENINTLVSVRFSKDIYNYMRPFTEDLDHEEFWVIFLNQANRIKGSECLSSGGMSGTVVDLRMLFRAALDMKAAYIIISHNHPGGSLQPSTHDELITRKIYDAGNILDIKLYDHIIIGANAYFSFADEGMLDNIPKIRKKGMSV